MITKKRQNNIKKFICDKCNFICSKKSDFDRHLLTAKHKMVTNGNKKTPNEFVCNCGKEYKHKSGLSRHKLGCKKTPKIKDEDNQHIESIASAGVFELVKQNQEFKQLLLDQSKQILDLSNKSYVINNNTTNNNNQRFNLNFFLNDTCKDAMSITDFLQNINVKLDELDYIGNHGYVNGMTKMIMDRLKTMDVTKRPIHCTDIKRETMYIKEDDGWSKDTDELTKLRKILSRISMTNYRTMPDWKTANPECEVMETRTYDFCYKMMKAILGDVEDEQLKLDNKIVKTLAKELFVNKNN